MSSFAATHRLVGAALTAVVVFACAGSATIPTAASPFPKSTTTSELHGAQFYAGSSIDVSDDVDGDVYAAGQSVTISGDITGDVIAAAQNITITGNVDGDVRVAAQSVAISGGVSRSGTIAAAELTVAETGSFGGDVLAAASSIGISGSVDRNLLLSVDQLSIEGTVGGDVTYESDTDARIDAGAVGGSVERIESAESTDVEVSPQVLLVGWLLGVLFALVALSLVTLAAGLLAPRWLRRVTDHLVPSPWKALLVGFVAAIAAPAAILLLLVTFVGAPLALAVGLLWTVLTLATFVYGAYYLGRLVFRDRQHPVVMSLVGGTILIVGLNIPWLNILVWTPMILFGLGAQLLEFWSQRPWAVTPARADHPSPTTSAPEGPFTPGPAGSDSSTPMAAQSGPR
ncbi:polymer-forming cytoskeletal protein [Labedella populi]|uniref:Polymer-forming cytoskeletal protein n=1 Tax=Labedella populi TaxID=2498850 RepID=A0A3S4DXF5_9MICO|nr:polymer-forming cytoskeletal protein [Labedella populi]RWZ58439.1 polymer-forming cytoskeletal protein [Labedella populi]